ncbi:putative pentatricopeptide repeat-containing protein At3g05240 [Dioscorea cayenensis subsp. rotundata]|uniref:Pentatricopeptide repeat-containing protein At3g05240 n=1 Tax=Dioscorea cayennensis subsp. rotundata TaxID=55577 RepID=A0AB40B177_DIOCR|nr:putative pentatricopeptide repeat-containing protein At3g05240 [Dioscorea cayenensis subsp. rotundata]
MITTTLITHPIPLTKLIHSSLSADLHHAHALSIFLHLHNPSLHLCNSMLRAFSTSQHPSTTLSLYKHLHRLGLSPDHFTFPFALKVCAEMPDRTTGRCIHSRVVKTGYQFDAYVNATLVRMYACCGDVECARSLFDAEKDPNVVAWTTMIAGYVANGRACEAIALFKEMVEMGITPNEITMVHVLGACAHARDLETGRWVHARTRSMGRCNVVLGTALVDMYARCGSLRIAREVFDEMRERNQVTWNVMISGYNQYEKFDDVFRMFRGMCEAGLRPDKVTLLSLLGACGGNGDLSLGQGVHGYVEKVNGGCWSDEELGTSLLDMYIKSGDTESAVKVFRGLKRRDVVAWTSMIVGLAMNGDGKKAVKMFKEMSNEGVRPDGVAFVGVMSACSHAGMVDEGRKLFDSMQTVYGVRPEVEHYGCMVDLLSRAGRLQEAEGLLKMMPMAPSMQIWGAMLSGCESYGEVQVAERVRDQLAEFDPGGSGVYVLLSNLYAGAGRWVGAEGVRELMWRRGVKKNLGLSSLQLKGP